MKVNRNIDFLSFYMFLFFIHFLHQIWPSNMTITTIGYFSNKTVICIITTHQFVVHTTNDDIAANFVLLQHFWPWFNNVFHQGRASPWRCDQKKTPSFSHDSKNGPPYPGTPAWRHIVVITILNHGHKKMGKKTLRNHFIRRHIVTQSTVCSTYPNYRPF